MLISPEVVEIAVAVPGPLYHLAVLARDDKKSPRYRALIVWQKQVTVSEFAAEVASKAV